jgi:hypothetical protein
MREGRRLRDKYTYIAASTHDAWSGLAAESRSCTVAHRTGPYGASWTQWELTFLIYNYIRQELEKYQHKSDHEGRKDHGKGLLPSSERPHGVEPYKHADLLKES